MAHNLFHLKWDLVHPNAVLNEVKEPGCVDAFSNLSVGWFA